MHPTSSMNGHFELDPIPDALESFKNGEFLIVVDNEDRENEGDLILAGQHMTPEKMAFMIRYTSGVICAPLTAERADQLELPLMVPQNTESFKTAFTITVDYIPGTTTGISASDRALTVKALADPLIVDVHLFARPGHIFPLRYTPGGILTRPGHTEASIDLCRLTGLNEVAAIAEITNDDGTMARRDDCRAFAKQFGIKMISIEGLAKYIRALQPSSH